MKFFINSVLFCFSVLIFAAPAWCQQKSTELYYFNQNLITTNSFLALPATYGATSGTDTARTIIGYSERFTCPYPNTFIDSVSVLMATDSFGADAYILVEAVPVAWTGGHPYANFNSPFTGSYVDTVYKKDTAELYSFPMSHIAIADTDFFVSEVAPYPKETKSFVWIDSLTSATQLPLDDERDRSRLLLDTPYGVNSTAYQYYLAGQHLGASALYAYPNLVMVTYVSSPAGSVAELYPANQDPLSFYVERTLAGETVLHFSTLGGGGAQIELFDASGTPVSTLFDGGNSPGQYDVPLLTGNLPNGIYFARLSTATASEVRRIIVTH
jgi:hypothetical protein